ncbi:NAD-dependent epimerase/dehydratase family protein [Nitratireductor mangrovi]|uniref:NAD-dependent epimerase/dehydratase family protein n=1 Tax=Nitratireductor mangrovi TaxID=2599600 RepID=A0A5B8KUK2_9HYPH|nr:vitamin K epoxide reductase family protein [Nitratireductor mangrovi]QDY99274.1 NAD-dependent epimerase/dehydratase family protein [Nitratireductor mangrovi]
MASRTDRDKSSKTRAGSTGGKPVILITGAAGDIGSALVAALAPDYTVVGLDLKDKQADCELFAVDLSSRDSVELALRNFRDRHGGKIASVIHLAAYFDFTGEDHPLYDNVNVEGTRNLLRALQDFEVGQFLYSGTMLVHRPAEPGQPIDERAPIEPKWAYPQSKARAEEIIREEHGDIPYVLLHLAGLYDERTAVPTLSAQIRRIYERDPKAHAYSGSLDTGQSFLHKDDMIDAFVRAVDRRAKLPADVTILVGEAEAASYQTLQERIANLIHDEEEWATYTVPKALAGAGAWLEEKSEPIVPDDFDQGEKPFIRPFMVEMADDHYELDITRARELLGWEPRHFILDTLPAMIDHLKADPFAWYRANGITPPAWLEAADERGTQPEKLRDGAEAAYRDAHHRFLWAPFLNMGLGAWLITSPPMLAYESRWMVWSDIVAGILVVALAFVSLSWRFGLIRWALAAVGLWVMAAPLVAWAPTAAAYLNGTLVGALVFGMAVLARPAPGVGILAATTGPTIPPGWEYSPSSWFQRLPIIILAFLGLYVSRYMAAYQLGHIDGVWEPFFAGAASDPKNGTEEIITSSVSQAWPVPDAGLGALTYLLEILTGIIGSSRRWRTMPWLVVLFGIMIVPLGVVSITFIVIQPIVLGTWCTLCLIAAAAMVIQIPYSVDELIATGQFLARRRRAGRPILRVFLFGDTDEGDSRSGEDSFDQSPMAIMRDMLGGGISVPWTLAVSVLIGAWLMFTRLTLGSTGVVANADHLIGSLVITTSVAAMAEAVRPLRFINTLFGMALVIIPFVAGTTVPQTAAGVVAGLALIALSVPRGAIRHRYGNWSRVIV